MSSQSFDATPRSVGVGAGGPIASGGAMLISAGSDLRDGAERHDRHGDDQLAWFFKRCHFRPRKGNEHAGTAVSIWLASGPICFIDGSRPPRQVPPPVRCLRGPNTDCRVVFSRNQSWPAEGLCTDASGSKFPCCIAIPSQEPLVRRSSAVPQYTTPGAVVLETDTKQCGRELTAARGRRSSRGCF